MKRFTLHFLLSLLFVLSTSVAFSFSAVSVKGKILDSNNQPVIAATVALLNAKDSSLAKVGTTEGDGTFELEVSSGSYLLKISAVGFDTYTSQVAVSNESVSLPEIKLSSVSVDLKEVTVTAAKPMIEVKPDKTVFNVEGSISAQGSNVLELLQKSPGGRKALCRLTAFEAKCV